MRDLFIFERNQLERENWAAAIIDNRGPGDDEDQDALDEDDDED